MFLILYLLYFSIIFNPQKSWISEVNMTKQAAKHGPNLFSSSLPISNLDPHLHLTYTNEQLTRASPPLVFIVCIFHNNPTLSPPDLYNNFVKFVIPTALSICSCSWGREKCWPPAPHLYLTPRDSFHIYTKFSWYQERSTTGRSIIDLASITIVRSGSYMHSLPFCAYVLLYPNHVACKRKRKKTRKPER